MSHNQLPDQQHNLPTTSVVGGFHSSSDQLMPPDVNYHHTYSTYTSGHSQHPVVFPYAGQQSYPPLSQTNSLGPAQHLQTQSQMPHQQQQHSGQQLQSPTSVRKRRASNISGPNQVVSSLEANAHPPVSALPVPVPAKKGRTNTPWTPTEEATLKLLREEKGNSWSEIAKAFPSRTEGSVKKHYYKDMHYAEFTEDEVSTFSAALSQAIKDYESEKWKVIGAKVGKPAKACESFAKEKGWKV